MWRGAPRECAGLHRRAPPISRSSPPPGGTGPRSATRPWTAPTAAKAAGTPGCRKYRHKASPRRKARRPLLCPLRRTGPRSFPKADRSWQGGTPAAMNCVRSRKTWLCTAMRNSVSDRSRSRDIHSVSGCSRESDPMRCAAIRERVTASSRNSDEMADLRRRPDWLREVDVRGDMPGISGRKRGITKVAGPGVLAIVNCPTSPCARRRFVQLSPLRPLTISSASSNRSCASATINIRRPSRRYRAIPRQSSSAVLNSETAGCKRSKYRAAWLREAIS